MNVPYASIPQRPRDLLDEVYTREGAEIWWNSPNKLLRTSQGVPRVARDLWADGEQDVILQVLNALADGVFL